MLTLISFILFLFTVAALFQRSKPASSSSKNVLEKIPGPRKLPLIGNLHLLLRKSPPHHIFRDLAVKHGPLMRLQLGEVPSLFVSSVEVAAQVLRTHDAVFANRHPALAAAPFNYNGTDIGFAPYDEYWRQLRKICALELLSARRVRCFRPIREEEIGHVAKCIASNEGSPVNLTERVLESSFDITGRASIGEQEEEKLKLVSAVKGVLKIFTLPSLYFLSSPV